MTRANSRFYEAEGLLSPQRQENSYRNHLPEDSLTLQHRKLLRSLHFSLEEIKSLHKGEAQLTSTLEAQLLTLEQEQVDLGQAPRICRQRCQPLFLHFPLAKRVGAAPSPSRPRGRSFCLSSVLHSDILRKTNERQGAFLC